MFASPLARYPLQPADVANQSGFYAADASFYGDLTSQAFMSIDDTVAAETAAAAPASAAVSTARVPPDCAFVRMCVVVGPG